MNFKKNFELKQEVKNLYRGNWTTAIKLNLVPVVLEIILRIFVFSILGVFGKFFTYQEHVGTQLNNSANSQTFTNTSTGGFIESYVTVLIGIGIMFSTLDWIRTKEAPQKILKSAFSVFTRRYFLGVFVIQILINIFSFLWGLMFIIPGIVKEYSYSQAQFIFKDLVQRDSLDKDISYFDCISRSRELMKGNKWRLFVLQLSFLGWDFLELITFGIASFWVKPYKNGTYAAFYNELIKKSDKVFE